MRERYDVYGVGNAIVDTEVRVEELMLRAHGLERGVMTLVASDEQAALLAGLDEQERVDAAGGSAARRRAQRASHRQGTGRPP